MLDSSARVRVVFCLQKSRNVYKCRAMYTYVAPILVFFDALLRVSEPFFAVTDGYRKDVLRALCSVLADLLRLPVFSGERGGFSICVPCFPRSGSTRGGSLSTLYHAFGTEIPNLVTNFSRKSITIVWPWSGGADPRFRGGHGLAGILCRRRPGMFDGFGRGTGQVLGPGLTGESVDQAVEGRHKA